MGKKRRLESDSLPHKNREKKHKSSEGTRKHGSEADQVTSEADKATRARLNQLVQLAKELASSKKSIRKHFATGGKEIASAISHLSTLLQQSAPRLEDDPGPQLSTEERSKGYPCVPTIVGASLPAVDHVQSNLPELPQISDDSLSKAVFLHQGLARDPAPGGHAPATSSEEKSYDRLEILGDAYIEVIATRLIWHNFQFLSPGRISQLRELLVKNETLAEYATNYGFDHRVSVPPDHRSQPKRWIKIKGDVFEAYVAAVILSNPVDGFERVETWLSQLFLPKLWEAESRISHSRCKQELAKKVVSGGIKLKYIEERPPKPGDGMVTFFFGVYLTGWGWTNQHLGSGKGQSKSDAGNDAANRALMNKSLIDEISSIKKSFDESAKVDVRN